jgi:hypothetical protein
MTMSARTLPMGSMLRSVDVTPVPRPKTFSRSSDPDAEAAGKRRLCGEGEQGRDDRDGAEATLHGELLGYVAGRGGTALYEW